MSTRYTLQERGRYIAGLSRRRDCGIVIADGPTLIFSDATAARDAAESLAIRHAARRLMLRGTARRFTISIDVVPIHTREV